MTGGRRAWLASVLLALAAAAAQGCNRLGDGAGEGGPPLVELRDARGQGRLALWKTADGYRWVDARDGAGRVRLEPGGRLRAQDARQGLIEAGPTAGAIELRRGDGTSVNLRREGGQLRVGDGAGIPMARLRADADEVVVHDAGGVVTLRTRRAGGRIVVTDREGAAVAFVVGQTTLERAALASLSIWSAGERAVLLALAEL